VGRPATSVLGGLVALGLIAARSEKAAVWLESATVHPTGVQFRIDVRFGGGGAASGHARSLATRAKGRTELPAELFRAGFELADGFKATWLGPGGGVAAVAIRPDQLTTQPPA
jgi:hypothetical protein